MQILQHPNAKTVRIEVEEKTQKMVSDRLETGR